MKAKGRRINRKITPDKSTRMEKMRPTSEWKVMSPKPRVLMTTMVQYKPVIQECLCPSAAMRR